MAIGIQVARRLLSELGARVPQVDVASEAPVENGDVLHAIGARQPVSPTGLRYQNHVEMNRSMLLFARNRADDRAFWFLGPGTYVSHEGEKPMAVTWRLDVPLPGDLFASFAAAVA